MLFSKLPRILFMLALAMGLGAPQAFGRLQVTSVLLPAIDVSQPAGSGKKLLISADGSSPIRATSIARLSFDLSKLPADATIEQVTLRLESMANNTNPQLVRVFTNPQGRGNSLAKWTAKGSETIFTAASDALRQEVTDRHRVRRSLELWLRSTSRFSDWTYASTRSNGDKPAAKPRLIVQYSRDLVPAAVTDRTAWRFYGEKNRFRVKPVRATETLLTSPAFYAGSVFLFAKPDDSHTNLLALSTNGRERWRSDITQTPGSHARVDPDGLLHAIGRERVDRYDLNRRGAVSGTTTIKDLILSLPPTLGVDGSVYFSNYGYARGLNPQLEEVWRYPQKRQGSVFSPLVLSSGAQGRAYVLARINGQNRLTSIDTGSGQWNEQPFDDKFTHFHAPIVIPDEQGDYLCLAVNAKQDGLLACHAGGEEIWSLPGPVSQPTASADGKRLYVVQKGCLRALDRFNGAELASFCRDGLAATSNLVLDGDGRVYFWNNGSFFSFDRDCKPLEKPEPMGLAESLQLLFAPDGTLFAVNPNPKNRQLALILPDRQSLTLGSSQLQDRTVYSADRLRIDADTRIEPGFEIALKAREGISVGKGFVVRKGARVSFKTGY